MQFSLNRTIEILERTPSVLEALLNDLSDDWTHSNEGDDTWSPFDVVGHLIYGEKTDWIPRMEIILSDREDKTFEPFDRFAQFRESEGKTMPQLLEEFRDLREQNLHILSSKKLSEEDLQKTAGHPALGRVTLSHLLASWATHDLNHIAQIARVMGRQYTRDVGPWKEYLGILG